MLYFLLNPFIIIDSYELKLEELQQELSSTFASVSDLNTFNEIKTVTKQFNHRKKKKPMLAGGEDNLAPFVISVPCSNLLQLFILVSDFPPVKKLY